MRKRNPQPSNRRRQSDRLHEARAPRPAGGPAARQPEGSPPRPYRSEGSALWLYGFHAVLAALANPARRVRRLLLTREAERALGERSARLPAERLAKAEIVGREVFDQVLVPGAVHQGIAVQVTPLPEVALDDVCATANGALVVLDQVTDPHNIGAVLRSTAAFGGSAVVVTRHHAPEETGALAKAASGALERVPMVRVTNLARALDTLKEAGFWCVGLDARSESALADLELGGRRVAVLLGAEGSGLRRLTRERCDLLARIPLPGAEDGSPVAIDSLNVSNAAAIALYELVRAG